MGLKISYKILFDTAEVDNNHTSTLEHIFKYPR